MDRTLFGAILLPVVIFGAMIAPAFADAAWDECLNAPKRACVFDEALRAAQTVADGAPRAGALATLARWESDAGFAAAAAVRQRAMQAARSLEKDSDREDALAEVAEAAGSAGSPSEAVQIAQSIKGARARSEALVAAAVGQHKLGLVKEADETFAMAIAAARSLESATDRLLALLWIAREQGREGFASEAQTTLASALRIAQSEEPGFARSDDLANISSAQLAVGDIDDALRIAGAIDDASRRAFQLGAGAQALARAGKLPEALEVINAAEMGRPRAIALAIIAKAQAKAGLAEEATGNFEQAHRAALAAPTQLDQAWAMSSIAAASSLTPALRSSRRRNSRWLAKTQRLWSLAVCATSPCPWSPAIWRNQARPLRRPGSRCRSAIR